MSIIATSLLIGGVLSGTAGVGTTIKAVFDKNSANQIRKDANTRLKSAKEKLDEKRNACKESLDHLAEEKIFILETCIRKFVEIFSQIKNIDFQASDNLSDQEKLHQVQDELKELTSMINLAEGLSAGLSGGGLVGALTAFGAYGAAQTFAAASTGTAISALSGAAATNATLAFFGGGSLAAGGMGIAGGTMVLGGLVAGPALLAAGFVMGHQAEKDLEKAKTDKAEAEEQIAQFEAAAKECELIRRRAVSCYKLLVQLDAKFLPLIDSMDRICRQVGIDYSQYCVEDKKIVASCTGLAGAIKAVIDTPLLNEDGTLTLKSQAVLEDMSDRYDC